MDGDDFFLPHKLEEQVAYFDANPHLDLVQSGWIMVNQAGEGLTDVMPWKVAPELNLETWVLHKCVRPSALMIRKIWWEKVGGFDHRLPLGKAKWLLHSCRFIQIVLFWRQQFKLF